MAKAVSPSAVLSPGQITKLTDLLSAGLRKAELPSDVSQQVIEDQGEAVVKEFVTGFRRRVEAISGLIARRVKVDRTRTPQGAINATGRTPYTNSSVVNNMPGQTGDPEVEVVFFRIGRTIKVTELAAEYESRGLVPADPYSLAAVNEAEPAFADTYPNGTQWQDAEGQYCFAAFARWFDGGRHVRVRRLGNDWRDRWFFAGVRKSQPSALEPKA